MFLCVSVCLCAKSANFSVRKLKRTRCPEHRASTNEPRGVGGCPGQDVKSLLYLIRKCRVNAIFTALYDFISKPDVLFR